MYGDTGTHGAYQHSPQHIGWQAQQVQQMQQQQQPHSQQNTAYAGTQPPPSLLMNGQPFLSTPDLTSDYSEDSSLASLAALRNPAWWDGMMLPG